MIAGIAGLLILVSGDEFGFAEDCFIKQVGGQDETAFAFQAALVFLHPRGQRTGDTVEIKVGGSPSRWAAFANDEAQPNAQPQIAICCILHQIRVEGLTYFIRVKRSMIVTLSNNSGLFAPSTTDVSRTSRNTEVAAKFLQISVRKIQSVRRHSNARRRRSPKVLCRVLTLGVGHG